MTACVRSEKPTCVRLKRRSDFLFVRHGRSQRRRAVVVQVRQNRDRAKAEMGIGFTATKKIGNAVIRNRAKRRLREASRDILPRAGLGGHDYVFIARFDTATIGWQRLLDDMESALISLADQLLEEAGTPSTR